MSKSILILGTPKNCRECKLEVTHEYFDFRCAKNKKITPISGRPDWCPLVELSQEEVLRSGVFGD